jgi:3-keto-disaccharide hydrolase
MRLALICTCICGAATAAAPEWQALSGEWTEEGDTWVGRAPAGEMAWLGYMQEQANFQLTAEFRTPIPANGGIQFRSHWLPKPGGPQDLPVGDWSHAWFGYQANIETRGDGATGGIVDENGRGHLIKPTAEALAAVDKTGWNTLRVRALESDLQVWVNDVLAAHITDERFIKGFFALQVMPFAEGDAVAEIHYRNLTVTPLPRAGAWRPLFDGTTLTGWRNWGEEEFTVEDGFIVGRSGPKNSEGYLCTEESWTDFRVRGTFLMTGKGNFGLFYHSTITLRDDGYPIISGVQGEVDPAYPGPSGWHYESYRRGWLHEQPDRAKMEAFALRPGQWSEIEIRYDNHRITSWVNGIRVTDFIDPAPQVFVGGFALQLHTGGTDGIAWKDIFVQDP